MLALIHDVPGVASAAVDETGHFLRLRLTSTRNQRAVETVLALLRESGHEAVAANEADRAEIQRMPRRWFDRASVRELSRKEAAVLADEIAAAVASAHLLDSPTRERLRETLRRHLEPALVDQPSPPDATLADRLAPALQAAFGDAAAYLDEASAETLSRTARTRLNRQP